MSIRCLGCMQPYEEGNICPYCGYDQNTPPSEAIHLMPGSSLHGRYIVGKTLGYGAFGATYIGYDEVLMQRVAIREYMPAEFSSRVPGNSRVMILEGEKQEQFADGLRKFLDEARRLARFQNEPGIIRIFDVFEENNTAYMIMEYLEGETLESYLGHAGTLPEDMAVEILTPVMESLKAVHAAGILHRDIAPANIFLTLDGRAKLIDFGAARYATTSHSRSLTVIIKAGYSPEEQYRSRGDQGPHTDVYALAATLYRMITGTTPPDALERRAAYENKSRDILIEPHRLNPDISQVRENAIMNALNVKIEDRTPDIGRFLEELNALTPAKRVYGSIRRMNLFRMPLGMKIAVASVLSVLLVFGVLLASGVISFSRFSQEIVIPDGVVVVPDVEGMDNVEAIRQIEGEQLLAVTAGNVESDYIPAGTIVLQTPSGGSYLTRAAEVRLMVSRGKILGPDEESGKTFVPYVVWSTLEEALQAFQEAGLSEPEIVEAYDDNVAQGQVISQDPEAGTEVEIGASVQIVVSLGPEAFKMPDLAGLSPEEAEALLVAKGLSVEISYVQDDSIPEGQILSQDISAGTDVKRGASVTITVAAKEATTAVADVRGKGRAEAEAILKEQGFILTILENFDPSVGSGFVISQTPAGGTGLKPGTNVTLYVSKGANTAVNPAPVPNTETAAPAAQTRAAAADPSAPGTTAAPKTTAAPGTTAAPKTTASPSTARRSETQPSSAASEESSTPAPEESAAPSEPEESTTETEIIAIVSGSVETVHILGPTTTEAPPVAEYTLSYEMGVGYTYYFTRTASPNKGAETGMIFSGSTIYQGDIIHFSMTVSDGYTCGTIYPETEITVTGDVYYPSPGPSVIAYVMSKTPPSGGLTGEIGALTIERTSSPLAGAPLGKVEIGSTVYYGDTLISYFYTTQFLPTGPHTDEEVDALTKRDKRYYTVTGPMSDDRITFSLP